MSAASPGLRWLLLLPAAVCAWIVVQVLGSLVADWADKLLCPATQWFDGQCLGAGGADRHNRLINLFAGLSLLAFEMTAMAVAPRARLLVLWLACGAAALPALAMLLFGAKPVDELPRLAALILGALTGATLVTWWRWRKGAAALALPGLSSAAGRRLAIGAILSVAAAVVLVLQVLVSDELRMRRVERVRDVAHWRGNLAQPLARRIGMAPPELMEMVDAELTRDGRPQRLHAAAPSPALLRDMETALATLPPEVVRAAEGRLAGVYLVDGLRFAGMAMQIYDARGAVSAGVIVIDITRIGELTANQWLTEQENRPFYPDGSRWTLRGTLADAAQDTRANALQFLLLHEIGHVLSVGTELAPPFSTFLEKPTLAAYPYFARFWQPGQEAYAPRPGADSPLRARVSYNRAALGAADMPAVYEWMRGTGFPSLYGAGNPWEDFAEAFATYVHTEMMGRPYAVTLYRDGAPTRSYAACWAEKRCEDRRPYVLRALQARRP